MHDETPMTLDILTGTWSKSGQLKKVREYVNVETGEIIGASEVPAISLGAKVEKRSRILDNLRPEVRQFAAFVLRFANKRRGITPGIDVLCGWYADIHGKRVDNVRRYVKTLAAAKVLMHESLLGPLFQRTGHHARDHLGEYENASAIYLRMRHQAFDPFNGKEKRIADPALVVSEVARLDAEMEAERAEWKARMQPMRSGSLTSMVPQPA